MDVTSLVLRAQRGSRQAHHAIYEHYRPAIQRKASTVANRNPGVDAHDVESALMMDVQRCVEQFDAAKGEFEHMLNVAWAKSAKNVVMKRRLSMQSLNDETTSEVGDVVDVEATVLADLAVREYVERIKRNGDDTLAKVALLIAQGEKHEDIARACGFDGSVEAAKMWTQRAIERIRRVVVAVGQRVRVKNTHTAMDGEEGVVLREADAKSQYTHVVRLSSGKTRAFDVGELEVL
jgi:DNA-directed RNA polymerase specialized sigma24 family protein